MIMKQFSTKILFTMLMSMVGANAFAYDIFVKNADGVTIYYNYCNEGKELEVTYKDDYNNLYKYSGNVVIPEEVTYMNRTRKVTSIGKNAFYDCHNLTSVTIGNCVTSIGNTAFVGCIGLTSVTIPNSVTSIGDQAFRGCSLTSVTIGNSVTSIGEGAFYGCRDLTSVTIGNSVISIGEWAFYDCSGLTSVNISDIAAWCNIKFFSDTSNPLRGAQHLYMNGEEVKDLIIPNSVTSIGNYTFQGYSGLPSVTIPNSVTSIGNFAFSFCNNLASVTIPNSVTWIGEYAFSYCSGLTSIIIPNSVTSIGLAAFYDCSGLTSVAIGNSVTTIGVSAFDGVDIPIVISLIENPFRIYGQSSDFRIFSQNTFYNATLYVPVGTIDKYKETEGWQDFLFMKEGSGGIDGINNLNTDNILVLSNGSTLEVSGADAGTVINVYDTAGRLVGTAKASAGTTSVGTSLSSGEIGIVKIGEKAVKVVIR